MSKKIFVRVNDQLARRKAHLHDPDQKTNPGSFSEVPSEAVQTPFVAMRMGVGELIEVEAPKGKKQEESDPSKKEEPPKKEK